jgi:hypothetical protein
MRADRVAPAALEALLPVEDPAAVDRVVAADLAPAA